MQHPESNPTQSTTHPTFEDMPTSPAPTPPDPAHTHPIPHTGSPSHPTRPPPVKRHHSDIEPDLDFSHPSVHLPPTKRHHDMRNLPTPHYQPSSYEPGQNEQGVADTTIRDDDQEEYDANTALQFPGIRNLHDEGQPILYPTMQRYWEREAHPFQGFTADDIAEVDLQTTSILNYRREIEDICQERFGLTLLLGDLLQRTIQAWAAPRRGYLFLRDISVVMIYQYAGVLDNGLAFHQLKYRNPSKTSHGDLMCALRALGATDAISVGTDWTWSPSMKLTPLRDLCWDNPTSTFFHPQATSAATLVDTKVHIGRLPPLTTTDDILAALRGSHLPTQTSISQGTTMPPSLLALQHP
ncbi:hypothetical protein H257_16904 [Aphanomyces astaci]|uniref:Uncharacterized protein n=1 Tax=Aphanomyces astaci TaxID=112090 RepID=W4FIM9_APHAT|nr:hypothetical protein H257_16904 [Aphanomyces astaci]ETV66694.1 hypothetical protein H257_16904 [Aphanomyces astaci]|eukprot:XP_009843819.1 hypothetical protein H257_16904 [Aphanomyces astaci]